MLAVTEIEIDINDEQGAKDQKTTIKSSEIL